MREVEGQLTGPTLWRVPYSCWLPQRSRLSADGIIGLRSETSRDSSHMTGLGLDSRGLAPELALCAVQSSVHFLCLCFISFLLRWPCPSHPLTPALPQLPLSSFLSSSSHPLILASRKAVAWLSLREDPKPTSSRISATPLSAENHTAA